MSDDNKAQSVNEPKKVVKEDRSAYNCPTCKGEGIVKGQNVLCSNCQGTGKV